MAGTAAAFGGKAAAVALKPVIDAIRQQVGRRGATQIAGKISLPASSDFDEAIVLVSESPGTLGAFLAAQAKKALSDVPNVLSTEDVRLWMQRDEVRDWLIAGARAAIAGQDSPADREAAGTSFAANLNDDTWWGEYVFDVAVAFIALSVQAKLTPGDRAVIDNAAFHQEQLTEKLDQIQNSLSQPVEAVRAFIEPVILKEERERSLVDDERPERLERLSRRVVEGDLKAAETDVRIALFQCTAAALARVKRFEDAEIWIEQARSAGANDLDIDRARVALGREDYQRVFELVGSRDDSVSVLLVADALKRRDGVAGGLSYIRRKLAPEAMSGFAIATMAEWLTLQGEWDEAEKLLASATEQQAKENPTLPYARMRLRLAMMLPSDRREGVAGADNALPQPSHLRNDSEGKRLREAALTDLAEFRTRFPDLDPDKAVWFDAQRLFLQLLDRGAAHYCDAVEEVVRRTAEPQNATLFASLTSSFSIEFDATVLNDELARKELLGGLKGHDLIAAMQLTIEREPADKIVEFIARHEEALIAAGAPLPLVVGIRIEIAAKQGRHDDAVALLDLWRERLDPSARQRLEAIINEAQDSSQAVETWRSTFEQTNEDGDLRNLVLAMIKAESRGFGTLAITLWERTRNLDVTIQAANALFNLGRDQELDELLDAIGDAGDHNDAVMRHKGWAAFRHGDLERARSITSALRLKQPDDAGLRQLEINIGLESGRWRDLAALAQQDWDRRSDRNDRQLLQAAEFAQIVDDPVCEELARAAVEKNPDDPAILTAAFGFAVRRGTDWGREAGQWLRGAAEKSGPDGPLRQGTLREFVDMSADRQEQNVQLDRMIMNGQLPLELAVKPLGATLSELILERMAGNTQLRDARERLCLPLVAGNRPNIDISAFENVAFDLPAILTLEMIGLLEPALRSFPKVVLAAGTMPQLFSDYIRSQRGQKSRFEQAQRVKAIIDSGAINVVELSSSEDDELAELSWAKANGAVYVHSYPINKPGSLGEQTVDCSADLMFLASHQGLIRALGNVGELDEAEAQAAASSVASYGQPWPDEVALDLSHPLLLDGLTLNALDHANVLGRLIAIDATLSIGARTRQLVEQEISQFTQAQKPLQAIDKVRETLVSAVAHGRAHHGSFRRDAPDGDDEDAEVEPGTLMALLSDASGFDALVSGDGMINRTAQLTDRNSVSRPILNVIDVIEHMLASATISANQRQDARRTLREAGVALVPMEIDEIVQAAGQGDWSNGPGRDLRAILASIHLPLLRKAVILPDEQYWLGNAAACLTIAIKRCWATLPLNKARPAATWLLNAMPDIVGYVGDDGEPDLRNWASNARAALHATLAQPVEVPEERLEEYSDWHQSLVAPQLEGRDRAIKPMVLAALSQSIIGAGPVVANKIEVPAADVRQWLLRHVPSTVRASLLKDKTVLEALELEPQTHSLGESDVDHNEMMQFLATVASGEPSKLTDKGGLVIAESATVEVNGDITISGNGQTLRFDFAGLLSLDAEQRRSTLKRIFQTRTLPVSRSVFWAASCDAGPLNSDQISDFFEELSQSPEAWMRALASKDELSFDDLVVADEAHYSVIFDPSEGLPFDDLLGRCICDRSGDQAVAVARILAPLAISPDFKICELVESLSDAEAAALIADIGQAGDPFSALAGFQIACGRVQNLECVAAGTKLLENLFGPEGTLDEIAHDFAAVSMAVIGHADTLGVLRDRPLPVRRAALFCHASWAVRALSGLDIKRPEFFQAVSQWVGSTFGLAGLLELGDSRWWFREWLNPQPVAGMLKARFKGLARSVSTEARPEEWSSLLSLNDESAPDLMELSSGPLDEFSPTWVTNSFPTDFLCKLLASEDAAGAKNAFFNSLLAFEMPDDVEAVSDHFIAFLQAAKGEELASLVRLGLMAAARWKHEPLAEAVLKAGVDGGIAENWSRRLLGEWCLAASRVTSSEENRAAKFEQHFRNIVYRSLKSDQAREIVGFLNKLADLAPELSLTKLRLSALLAT